MRTALLVPIAALVCIGACATVAFYAVRESRRLDRPPAAEAATDLGES